MNSRTLAKTKNQNSTTFSPVFDKKLSSRSVIPQPANEAPDVSSPNFAHNFGDVQVESPSFKQSCPLSLSGPSHCPFGGACHTCQPRVQAKLKIGQPGDKYEQEADRVAEQVMQMPEPRVQRKSCVSCNDMDEDEQIQAKPVADRITPLVQRQEVEPEEEEEEEIVQAKQVLGQSPKITPELTASIQSSRGSGQPLPARTRAFFEPRFGHDFSQVRVHTDAKAVDATKALQARAFTIGQNIMFGMGQFDLEMRAGRQLLAHELVHII